MTKPFTGKLEKIDNYRWRIPKSYMPGMRVPGIIYSDEEMLKSIVRDNAPQQLANAAHMPGIVKAAMAMPDIHWGYGLPIGGVVATDIEEGGIISPGSVGYDINCLCGDAEILLDNGSHIKMKDFEKIFEKKKLSCMNFGKKKKEETRIKNFIKVKPENRVFEVETLNGNKIIATEDHPFWTPDGMIPLRRLGVKDAVAVYPFDGVPYEEPSDEMITDEQDIRKFLLSVGKDSKGNCLGQVIKHLKERELLPLRYNSPQLPYILKIMGYNFGDGNIYFNKKRGKGCSWFYGTKGDLENIRKDIEKIGFRCSRPYSRTREHEIKTMYSTRRFTAENFGCKVSASGLAALLVVLGTPLGNKTTQAFRVPTWIKKAPLWQKRLFLASFFGAEMSTPKTMKGHGYNFYCPVVSMNKKKAFTGGGREFLSGISGLLKEFNVSTHKISERAEQKNKDGDTSVRQRLLISDKTGNLINLYSKVGFEYNKKRSARANVAAQYLKLKRSLTERRQYPENGCKAMATAGASVRSACKRLDAPEMNFRFAESTVYGQKEGAPRVGKGTITYDEFLEYSTKGLDDSGMLWDRIESIKEIEFDNYVYDFTVAHEDHNFIADNFVVSNCGVRLVRTDLTQEDVKPRMKELVDTLYARVPTGVGSSGKIKVDTKEESRLLVEGTRWAVGRGFGWPEDADHTEEGGSIEGADPSKVSQRAYERGKGQAGTLGSGNHFLEVQVVDEVYDEKIAEIFGIKKGLITVMIHCGSRGLGHQICGDYAQRMVKLLTKFNISIPDRQLSCVPVKSNEGQDYLGAMRCAANYAWANRQVIMHLVRQAFEAVFGENAKSLGMNLVYDVAHNIAKIEKYRVDGQEKLLCVHRKGATRAFPPGHEEIPEDYKEAGQPVIIPGDMGRYSFLLAGTEAAEESFYSTCHGAGRLLSRTAAKRQTRGRRIAKELEAKGIKIRWTGRDTLYEEVSEAYKDVGQVVDIVHMAGLSKKIAKMRPLGVVKG
ncbi:MAG: intein-containing RctB family protein [Candidatus Omnitrophota bacterium]|jgi:tRNA-splicing ligase RtcB